MKKLLFIVLLFIPLTANAEGNVLSCVATDKKISFSVDKESQRVQFLLPQKKEVSGIVEARYYKYLTRVNIIKNEKDGLVDFLTLYVSRENGEFSAMMKENEGKSGFLSFNGSCVPSGFAF